MGNLKETPWTEVMTTLEALAHAGAIREDLKSLRINQDLARRVVDLLVKERGAIASIFRVHVDYGLSVEEAKMMGNYHRTSLDINERNFPRTRIWSADIDIHLLSFPDMTSDQIIKKLNKMIMRPIELPELLALGAQYPDEQTKNPLVALGAVCWGQKIYKSVAILSKDEYGRYVDRVCYDNKWPPHVRFPAISQKI